MPEPTGLDVVEDDRRVTRVRPGAEDDRELLAEATLGNLNWSGPRFTMDQVRTTPKFWHYVDPWPGPGDFGFVAEDESGRSIGVVWLKHFPASAPGYGYVDTTIPELSVYVVPEHRCRGVGEALLVAAVAEARDRGLAAISLSVEDGNPALRLYSRLGFLPAGPGLDAGTYLLELSA